MGDLGHLYKVYLKVITKKEQEESEEEFGCTPLKIRNNNKVSYRFYDEEGNTENINKGLIDGVFIKYELEQEEPALIASFVTEEKDLYNLISGIEPPKDEEEEKGLEDLKQSLRDVIKQGLEKMITNVKKAVDKNLNDNEEKNIKEMVEEVSEQIDKKHGCGSNCSCKE